MLTGLLLAAQGAGNFPWTNFITGIVGLAGVAATLVVAVYNAKKNKETQLHIKKIDQQHDVLVKNREHRIAIYEQTLDAMNQIADALQKLPCVSTGKEQVSCRDCIYTNYKRLNNNKAQYQLFATQETNAAIAAYANAVFDFLLKIDAIVFAEQTEGDPERYIISINSKKIEKQNATVIKLMKKDLGNLEN